MKKWYKKWWIWGLIFLFVVTLISIPFIINESYKKGTGYITLWNAPELLAFYGSVLSLIGSIIVSIVAIWQNKKASDLNKKLMGFNYRQKMVYLIPQNNQSLHIENMQITFYNKGNSIGLVHSYEIYINGTMAYEYEAEHAKIFIENDAKWEINPNFAISVSDGENINFCIVVTLENQFEYVYKQKITMFYEKYKNNNDVYILEGYNTNLLLSEEEENG